MAEISPKILLAEDDKTLARALELKLTSAGYAVKLVGNGSKAIEALKNDHFDLVLLDLVMPVKDGFAVLAEKREMKNGTPVVVLTNLGQSEDEEKCKQLGAIGYLVKADHSLAEIINYVDRQLKRK